MFWNSTNLYTRINRNTFIQCDLFIPVNKKTILVRLLYYFIILIIFVKKFKSVLSMLIMIYCVKKPPLLSKKAPFIIKKSPFLLCIINL